MNMYYAIEEAIPGGEIASAKTRDTLHVRWSLRRSCNYSCPYCERAQGAEDCVLVRERALAMAEKILFIPHEFYDITFAGGEPALYPFLPEIAGCLLESGRDLSLTLETNGSQAIDEYLRIAAGAGPDKFRFAIFVHPAFADLAHILTLIAALAQRGYPVRASLAHDLAAPEKLDAFLAGLAGLRRTACFEMDILPVGGDYDSSAIQWRNEARRRFHAAAVAAQCGEPAFAIPKQDFVVEDAGVPNGAAAPRPNECFKNYYCCLGSNLLLIEPDGHFYGAACAMAPADSFLWKANALAAPGRVVRCRLERCPGGPNAVLPKFAQKEEALAFMAERSEKIADALWERGAPGSAQVPGPLDILWSRLKNLAPARAFAGWPSRLPEQKKAVRERFSDIGEIMAGLEDDASRDTFLRVVKALMEGDASYLKDLGADAAPRQRGSSFAACAGTDSESGPVTVNLAEYGPVRAKQVLFALRGRHPHLRLKLPLDLDLILDIFAWLPENYPGHLLLARWHEALPNELTVSLAPKRAGENIAPAQDAPQVSVIVPACGGAMDLARTLDSILLQTARPLETVIVDNASGDETPQIIRAYIRRYPALVRSMRLPEKAALGAALNHGLQMAAGEFIAFADCGDTLAAGFLEHGIALLREKQADIAVFDYAWQTGGKDGGEYILGLREGELEGPRALEALLHENFGAYGVQAKLFRKSLLAKAVFLPQDRHASLGFLLPAFFAAAKVVASPLVGCRGMAAPDSIANSAALEECLAAGETVRKFYANTGLDWQSGRACLRRLYCQSREAILAAIAAAENDGSLPSLLGRDVLLRLGRLRDMVVDILADYALAWCAVKGIALTVAEGDLDWRTAASRIPQPAAFHACGGSPSGPAPLLSVIMPNYNKAAYLEACLRSILGQSERNYELIIIDDASDDGSYELLQACADMNPRVRLYRMERNAGQGTCRNIGLELARGQFIIFVDSDDICLPGFFATAIQAIQSEGADIVAFSTEQIEADGVVAWQNILPNENLGRDKALAAFFKGKFEPAPWGKIYRAETAARGRFAEGVWHQDVPFFFEALAGIRKISLRSDIVYHYLKSGNSAIRPVSVAYGHVHSVCVFQAKMREQLERFLGRDWPCDLALATQSIWNIEHILLEKCAAFLRATGEIPLTDGDFRLLGENPLFLASLLASFSRFHSRNQAFGLIDAPVRTERFHKHMAPLVTVFVKTGAAELAASLNSLLAQSCEDFEALVFDDTSPDACAGAAEAFAQKDGRIILCGNDAGKSLADRLKFALELSSARYFFIMDSGAILAPDFLLHGIAALENDPDLDFVQLLAAGADKMAPAGEPLSGRCLLAACRAGKLADWGAWNRIYRHSFLARDRERFARACIDADVWTLQVCAAASRGLVLDAPGIDAAQPRWTAYRMPDALNALFALDDFEFPAESLAGGEAKNALITEKLRHLAKCFRNAGAAGEVFIPDRVLTGIAARDGILDALLCDMAQATGENANWPVSFAASAPVLPVAGASAVAKPELSFVILARNSSANIRKCLESAAAQNSGHAEIIVIDDASDADDTLALCRNMAASDTRLAVFRTAWRSGRAAAMHHGLEKANGKYIVFLEPAETLYPGFARRALAKAALYPECQVFLWSWDERDLATGELSLRQAIQEDSIKDGVAGMKCAAGMGDMPLAAQMYDREFLLASGLRPDENTLFAFAACAAASKVLFSRLSACLCARNGREDGDFDALGYANTVIALHDLCRTRLPDCPHIYGRLLQSLSFERTLPRLLALLKHPGKDGGPLAAKLREAMRGSKTVLRLVLRAYVLKQSNSWSD